MKKFLLIPVLFFSSLLAFARDFNFNLEPTVGLRFGHIGEYVICIDSPYDKDILSYLEWDIQSDILLGLKADLTWKYFSIETSIKSSLPKTSGQMQDSDWMNITIPNLPDKFLYKTHYTSHNNEIDNHFNANAALNFKVPVPDPFGFSFFGKIEYDSIKMSGYKGSGWHGSTKIYKEGFIIYPYYLDGTPESWNSSYPVISYTLESIFTWLGTTISYNFTPAMKLNLSGAVSIYTYATGLDNHFSSEATSVDYLDLMNGFFSSFYGNLNFKYVLPSAGTISISSSAFYQSLITGPDYQKNSSQKYYYESDKSENYMGGSDSFIFELSVGYCFSF